MARRKRKLSRIYVISLAAHAAVGVALAMIPQEKLREVVAIALNEAPPPKKEPPPPPPPKPAPPSDRPARAARAPRAAPARAPVSAAADSNDARTGAFQELGLVLDSSSSDGIAVPIAAKVVAPVEKPAPVVAKPKVLVAKRTEPECLEPLVKPRPLQLVRPSYTDDARRARVEGRVRIELAVNDQGVVTSAKVLDSLGHGLDEAALAAARELRFAPATHCKKAVSAPFVIAMRFQLGS
jgi:protein TonB